MAYLIRGGGSLESERWRRRVWTALALLGLAAALAAAVFLVEDPDKAAARGVSRELAAARSEVGTAMVEAMRELGISQPPPLFGDVGDLDLDEGRLDDLRRLFQEKSGDARGRMRELRDKIADLPPNARLLVFDAAFDDGLADLRSRLDGMSEEEKSAAVERLVERMRARGESNGGRGGGRGTDSPEAKELVDRAMDGYMNKLSAKERELFDPVMGEILYSMGAN